MKTPTLKDKLNSRKQMVIHFQNPTIDKEQERKTAEEQRVARQQWYMGRYFSNSGDQVYAPMDDPETLVDSVATNGILQSCNRFVAAAIGRLGYYLDKSPYIEDEAQEKEKSLFEKWIRKSFDTSFSEVCYRVLCDYRDTGMGLFRIDHNAFTFTDLDGVKRREISKVTHQNRLVCQPLKPKQIKRTINGKEMSIDDPKDVEFPRWIINTGDDVPRYAISFGDKRFVNKYTGEVSDKSFGLSSGESLDGPSILPFRQYDARDEMCGWPLWYAENQSVEISWEIGRYEWGHFRGNCMPNLIMILPEGKLPGGKTLTESANGFMKDCSEQREAGSDYRKVFSLEVPLKAISNLQGKIPIHIQEIKGPDPDKFLEMNKHKGQRIANACQVPPSLIHADTGALGSGADKEADLARFKELVLEPEQSRFEQEVLDKIILTGTQFRSYVIRLNEINTSDPKLEAEVAEIWSRVPQKLSEFRNRIVGCDEPIDPDSKERSAAIGQVWMFGTQGLISIDDLESITQQAIDTEPQPEEPPEPTDGERFAAYLRTVLNVTPEQFRDHVIPAIQERVATWKR